MAHRAHGRDLRKRRYSEPNRVYFVTFVAHRRRRVFRSLVCARTLIRMLHDEPGAESLAFVVMPDHVHWLLRLTGDAGLRQVMKSVKGRSGYRINKLLGRRGPFWQAGYHDRALRRDENLVKAARYLVANPLRAGLVKRLGDYPHWDAVWL